MSKHWRVTQQLVDNVRLGSIEGSRVMSDVLGRVENLECKSVQELPLGQEATDGFESPASA